MNTTLKTTNLLGIMLVKSVLNVTRSIFFNLFILALGFCLGYYALALKVHYYATVNDDYDYISAIELHVKQLETMDNEYAKKQLELLDILKGFKHKASHEAHHECDSKLGTLLYK